jgi:TolA-binding protein
MSKSKSLTILVCLLVVVSCKKLTDEDLWNNGVEAQKANKIQESLQDYQQLLDEYPKSPKVPDALYAIGSISQDKSRDIYRAIRSYRRIVEEYPTHPTASSAQFLIGFLYNNELKNVDSARIAYEEFLNKYPDNPMTSSAKFELANLGKDPNEIISMKTQPATQTAKKGGKKAPKK